MMAVNLKTESIHTDYVINKYLSSKCTARESEILLPPIRSHLKKQLKLPTCVLPSYVPLERNTKISKKSTSTMFTSSDIVHSNRGTRCGEIFVTNNTHQWTFICTFCNKSTRDIGEFICHININHLSSTTSENCNRSISEDNDNFSTTNFMHNSNYYDSINKSKTADHKPFDVRHYTKCRKSFNGSDLSENSINPYNNETIQSVSISHLMPACTFRRNQNKRTARNIDEAVTKDNIVLQIAAEYLDCGNNIDFEVHTGMEDTNCNEELLEKVKKPQKSEESTAFGVDISKIIRRKPALHYSNGLNHTTIDPTTDNLITTTTTSIELETTTDDDDGNESFLSIQYPSDRDAGDDFDNQLLLTPMEINSDNYKSSILPGSGGAKIATKRRHKIPGRAYCSICDKTFQYYSLYREHMIKHTKLTPYKCHICRKGFKSKQALRYHIKTHQKNAAYRCKLCNMTFKMEKRFIIHVGTHESSMCFPCTVCGTFLATERERTEHLAAHSENRPFRCDFCPKLFRYQRNVSNHLKLHGQYRCDICKLKFHSIIQLHKPYKCSDCESGTTFCKRNPSELFASLVPPMATQHFNESINLCENVMDSDEEQAAELFFSELCQ